MPKPKKPQDPLRAAGVESIRLFLTRRVLVALVLFVLLFAPRHEQSGVVTQPLVEALVADVAAPMPMQEWTTDAGSMMVLAAVLPGRLPEPDAKQKRQCDRLLGEHELNGGCWMPTDVPPPCPEGRLWLHEDKCWRPIPKTARVPQSGEPRPVSIADP